MQCHTIKIAHKLNIYNRFKNNSSSEIDYTNKSSVTRMAQAQYL